MTLSTQFAAFQADYPYREFRVGGRLWRYRVGGRSDGLPVLVLAGATMVPDPLFVVISALGGRYRVIAPAYPPAKHIDDLVAGVAAVLHAEQVTSAQWSVPPSVGTSPSAWYAPIRSWWTSWCWPRPVSATSPAPRPSRSCAGFCGLHPRRW